jgi:hypothetical protein
LPILALSVIFAVISVVLLTGHGAGMIAGYNTADETEKQKYRVKRLCRVIGGGFAVIALLTLLMAICMPVLTAGFAYVFAAVVVADCAVMIILAYTICRK